jgi:branched-chain amino acid transport system ATP-binding protein
MWGQAAMLRLESFACGYGPIRAVHGLDVELPAGQTLALLGPNGAGKTSTIMAIVGQVAVQGGRILYDGEDLAGVPAVSRAARGIALVPEGRCLFNDLSVDDNLTIGGYCRKAARDRPNRQRVFDLFPRLYERRRQPAGTLSGGEQQMLAMGRALMAEPRLLLIDELSLGLMPKMVDQCFAALAALKRDGLTMLLVEQNTARALDVADRVCVLSSGVAAFQGTAAQAREMSLFDAFLGTAEA